MSKEHLKLVHTLSPINTYLLPKETKCVEGDSIHVYGVDNREELFGIIYEVKETSKEYLVKVKPN